jgi:hypothetical protein
VLNELSKFLIRASTGKVALLGVLIFLAFGVLVLPREAARAEQVSRGAGSPDTTLMYTREELYSLAEAYGSEGRRAYVRARYTFDIAFPFVYGFFLVTAIGWLLAKVTGAGNRLRMINLIPILGVLFDFLENLSTSIVMLRYPQETDLVAALAPILSLVKWIFVYGSFAVLGVLVLIWVVRRITGTRTAPD